MAASTLVDLVQVSTATTGTGTMTLGSAVAHFRGTSALTDGATYDYRISDGASDYEIGSGVYTASGTTLTRVPTFSSNANAAINLSGTATVTITALSASLNAIGQWKQIATVTVSSPQAAVDFSSIPLTYGTLVLIYNGSSHNDAGSPTLQVQFSNDNGTTKTTAINIASGIGAAFPVSGGLQVVGYAKDFAFANPSFTTSSTSLAAVSGSPTVNSIAILAAGGINFIRLIYSAGSFDAGTFTLYGI